MPMISRKVLVFTLVVVSLFAVFVWDLTRPPLDQWSARLLLGASTPISASCLPLWVGPE